MLCRYCHEIASDLKSTKAPDLIPKVGILLFSFGVFSYRAIAAAGLLLIFAWSIYHWPTTRQTLQNSATARVAAVLAIYILISSTVSSLAHTEHWEVMLEEGLRHFYLLLFVLFGLALSRNREYLFAAIILAIAGFFIARFIPFYDLITRADDWWRIRDALGFPTAIPMGQYALAIMLGLIIFLPRLASQSSRTTLVIWLVLFLASAEFIVISQSRSAWLVAPVFLIATIALMYQLRVGNPKTFRWIGFSTIGAIIVVGIIQYPLIESRLTAEEDTWNQLFSAEISGIPSTTEEGAVKSIGIRVNMIEFGFEKWSEKPIFGWGAGATKMLIQCCAPDSFKEFNDLHSAYPEMLVRFGLVGAVLTLCLVMLVMRDAYKSTRKGALPKDIFLFVILCLALHFIVAVANYRVLNYDWRFYWIFFAGIAMAFALPNGNHKSAVSPY